MARMEPTPTASAHNWHLISNAILDRVNRVIRVNNTPSPFPLYYIEYRDSTSCCIINLDPLQWYDVCILEEIQHFSG
jgi:hypothetical protein